MGLTGGARQASGELRGPPRNWSPEDITHESLPKLCPHREPLVRFAVSFGSRENEGASVKSEVMRLLLECGADPLERKYATRPLLPTSSLSPLETFLESFQQCRRDGRLLATPSHDGDSEPLLSRYLAVLNLLLSHAIRRNWNASQLVLASIDIGDDGGRLGDILTSLEEMDKYQIQISEAKRVLLKTGYLLQSQGLKIPLHVPAITGRARQDPDMYLDATSHI